jgi:SAM-dependent methyltransferase
MNQDKFTKYQDFVYNTIYSEPDTPNFHTPLIRQAIDQFVPAMNLDYTSAILDVGCGQGAFMEEMKQRGFLKLCGITYSLEDVAACEAKGFPALREDFSDMSMLDSSINMVWCRHALEHSPYPLFTLIEFNRVLADGGHLYVEVPAPNCERMHENNPNHFSILGDRMWANLFVRAGFQLKDYRQISFDLQMEEKSMKETFYCFVLTKEKTLPCNQSSPVQS